MINRLKKAMSTRSWQKYTNMLDKLNEIKTSLDSHIELQPEYTPPNITEEVERNRERIVEAVKLSKGINWRTLSRSHLKDIIEQDRDYSYSTLRGIDIGTVMLSNDGNGRINLGKPAIIRYTGFKLERDSEENVVGYAIDIPSKDAFNSCVEYFEDAITFVDMVGGMRKEGVKFWVERDESVGEYAPTVAATRFMQTYHAWDLFKVLQDYKGEFENEKLPILQDPLPGMESIKPYMDGEVEGVEWTYEGPELHLRSVPFNDAEGLHRQLAEMDGRFITPTGMSVTEEYWHFMKNLGQLEAEVIGD